MNSHSSGFLKKPSHGSRFGAKRVYANAANERFETPSRPLNRNLPGQ